MIKVKVNNEYKDVVKIFCGGTLQKEIVKVWSREAQEYVYESSVEYTGSLPITINANGDVLIDYRIYGADGGVGVATENLFDKNTITPKSYLKSNGSVGTFDEFLISDFIPVEDGEYLAYRTRSGYTGCYNCIYDENKNFLRSIYTDSYQNKVLMTIGSNEKYIRISANMGRTDVAMVVKGSTAPTEYEPYGYKLPMTIGDGNTTQTVPVYIGENQLMEDEYVSYGEQKIYKRTENLIPSPEAQTQTSNGVTATCDGNGVYTFTGTAGENGAYFEFPIEEFTTPNLSDTDFIISLFNTKGLSISDTINIGGVFYINPKNRIIENPSTCSNKKVSKISFRFQPNRETNFTMSPMLVLGTVAPSQFVPYIVLTDPPVPLPEIPTIDGTTVIDYDGDPKPSQMYVKYRR